MVSLSCEHAGDASDVGDEQPCFGAGDGFLPILGHAQVYSSEGSGRIAGLAWATGLVELPDAAVEVAPGDPVQFLPYAGFGLSR